MDDLNTHGGWSSVTDYWGRILDMRDLKSYLMRSLGTIIAASGVSIMLVGMASAQAEWYQMRQQCINSGGKAADNYQDWVAQNGCQCGGVASGQPTCPAASGHASSGPSAPTGPTPVQQMELQGAQQLGGYVGDQINKALFGSKPDPVQQQADLDAQRMQQQRPLIAQQLVNSGLYLLKQKDYAGALNEFQQALAQTPDDPDINKYIALAKQQIRGAALAAKNGEALGRTLGSATVSSRNVGSNQTGAPPSPNASSSPLNSVNLNSDSNAVNSHGPTQTPADSAALKVQLDSVFATKAPASVPPAPSQWPGPQRPANEPKLVNPLDADQQNKAALERKFDAIFTSP